MKRGKEGLYGRPVLGVYVRLMPIGKKDTGYLYKAFMVALEACSSPKYGMLHTSFLHHILHGWLRDFARKTAWRVVRASLPPRFVASAAAGQRSSPV